MRADLVHPGYRPEQEVYAETPLAADTGTGDRPTTPRERPRRRALCTLAATLIAVLLVSGAGCRPHAPVPEPHPNPRPVPIRPVPVPPPSPELAVAQRVSELVTRYEQPAGVKGNIRYACAAMKLDTARRVEALQRGIAQDGGDPGEGVRLLRELEAESFKDAVGQKAVKKLCGRFGIPFGN